MLKDKTPNAVALATPAHVTAAKLAQREGYQSVARPVSQGPRQVSMHLNVGKQMHTYY